MKNGNGRHQLKALQNSLPAGTRVNFPTLDPQISVNQEVSIERTRYRVIAEFRHI
jgi:hypothetical protein